ncbi:unnamed protein product [Gongylonema pulchrum]|uniref:Uncharacterized protein n=1 Tax=Gongylonema pulchrum TaxID=637853 RepID=A0A183D625_9BILA|nr:unnamed protein product [Gongylonema pulchrum]
MPATTFGSQRFAQPIGVPSNRLPSFGSQSTYEKPFIRYVNARQPTPPRLDYAAVTVGQSDESLPAIASDVASVDMASSVNYTKIDLEKTRAVEVAASTVEKENPHRRQFPASTSLGS